ncbi:unnamed protein product [Prunus armeniaca]
MITNEANWIPGKKSVFSLAMLIIRKAIDVITLQVRSSTYGEFRIKPFEDSRIFFCLKVTSRPLKTIGRTPLFLHGRSLCFKTVGRLLQAIGLP